MQLTRRFSALGDFANSRDFYSVHVNSRDFYISSQFSILSGRICPQVHIIYALYSEFLSKKISKKISISSEILMSPDICPVTDRHLTDWCGPTRQSEISSSPPVAYRTNSKAFLY